MSSNDSNTSNDVSSQNNQASHASAKILNKNEQNQILPVFFSDLSPQICQNMINKDISQVQKLNSTKINSKTNIVFDKEEEKKNNIVVEEQLQMQDEGSLVNSEYVEVILQREGSLQPLEITRKLSKEKLERKNEKLIYPEKISSFSHLSSQLISSEIKALEAIREQQLQKPVSLNVLVAGKASLGKSSFIDAFLDHKFKSSSETSIRGATDQIIEKKAQRKEGKMTFNLTMIDTPGYQDHSKISEWLDLINRYITQKFDEFRESEKKQSIPSSIMDQAETIDSRVHCCLYFLSGPRVSERDMLNVQSIQKYVAVIPILAKGDTFTLPEITQFKEQLVKSAQAHQIHWFDIDSILQEQPKSLHKLWHSPFGAIPPFVIISSPSKQRQFTWGICDIQNPEHSDFVLLYNLLIGLFSIKLIRITAAFYKFYLAEKKKKEKESQKRIQTEQQQKKGIATAFSVGVVAIGYFALKLFK